MRMEMELAERDFCQNFMRPPPEVLMQMMGMGGMGGMGAMGGMGGMGGMGPMGGMGSMGGMGAMGTMVGPPMLMMGPQMMGPQ
eukprot:3618563-Alexandrium_andersonii.AAC.1